MTIPATTRRHLHWWQEMTALMIYLATCSSAAGVADAQMPPSREPRNIPVIEVPAASGRTLALFWSGDGGWRGLTSEMSEEFVRQGIGVLGVNSRAWLTSSTRTTDSLINDSASLLRHYMSAWNRNRIMLIGYSRGAGFSAILAGRLPPDLLTKVESVVLIGMEHTASFEFHLSDLVRNTKRPSDIPIRPFIDRISGIPVICVYGTSEDDTVCPELDPGRVHLIGRDGSHHFDRNYKQLARDVLAVLRPGTMH